VPEQDQSPKINLKNKVLTVLGSKTGEKRSIPLTRQALEVLDARRSLDEQKLQNDLVFTHPGVQMVNIYTLRTAFVTALEKVQMEDLHWHDLRHTFASRLAQAGVDPYTIQRLMGHKSFTTTQRYAHHYVESLRRGIYALDMQRPEAV
jgi:integrase